MSVVVDAIEGPPGAAARWSSIDWPAVRRHVSRLQTRIVKATKASLVRRVLHGALSRLEPSAVKVARSVLRGGVDRKVCPLPDHEEAFSLDGNRVLNVRLSPHGCRLLAS